jgi:hypothetical protein
MIRKPGKTMGRRGGDHHTAQMLQPDEGVFGNADASQTDIERQNVRKRPGKFNGKYIII